MRDQERARHAYERIGQVPRNEQDDYKVAVNALGPNVMRSGLAATVAFVERRMAKDMAFRTLLEDLAAAGIPGLENSIPANFGNMIRRLPAREYMLATREFLRVALWFKRAVQAGFGA
jgi:CRISPR-associated protein Cmr5